MKVAYPELAAEIARRGMRKKDIAARIHISDRSLCNKLQGKTAFTWNEVSQIHGAFFPELDVELLFKPKNPEQGRNA